MSQTLDGKINSAIKDCKNIIKDKRWPQLPFDLNSPKGDFSIICFAAVKTLSKKPEEIAKELASELDSLDNIQSIEIEKGYCNVNLNWKDFAATVVNEIKDENYAKTGNYKKKILIEHTSANATGPFHMGRARNPIIGDSIARLLRYYGNDVNTEYYVNDTGRQAATLAYGLENFKPSENMKKDHSLVECYRLASEELKKNKNTYEKIYSDMELIEKGDKNILSKVKSAAREMMEGMKLSLERLGTEADTYFYESDLIDSGAVQKVITNLKKSPLCKNEKNALFLDLEKEGIAGRNQKFFFTRQNGLSLYTTRDIAYHLDKFKRCNHALNILGEDHRLQGRLLGIALRELGSKEPENLFYSFVNLPGGKMSTRAGRVVYLDDIMEQIIDLAKEKLNSTNSNEKKWKANVDDNQKEKLAEDIGIGALRYNIIKVQAEKGFTFNIEDALNLQGDSAPFAMYSHARTCSIINKYSDNIPPANLSSNLEPSEIKLLRILAKWPTIVKETSRNMNIHKIPNYIHKLASDFNVFYRDCPVLDNDNEKFRINLVSCTQKILRDSLEILGIKAPKIM